MLSTGYLAVIGVHVVRNHTGKILQSFVNTVWVQISNIGIGIVVVTPSSLRRLLVILYQDFLGNF